MNEDIGTITFNYVQARARLLLWNSQGQQFQPNTQTAMHRDARDNAHYEDMRVRFGVISIIL